MVYDILKLRWGEGSKAVLWGEGPEERAAFPTLFPARKRKGHARKR